MKINKKNASMTKSLSWLGKISLGLTALGVTALIFVSCGFNKKQETNSNIGDFVDFVSLVISVEEKEEPTFGLTGGFNLVADGLTCDKIDYEWDDSASGYNPTAQDGENKAIHKVKFIDLACQTSC